MWERPEERPDQVLTPLALRGWSARQIFDQGRHGSDPAARAFVRHLDTWVAAQKDAIDFKTGLPQESDQEIWNYVMAIIDVQAEEARNQIADGQIKGQEALVTLATLAAEEKQARIDGEKDSERRHDETVKWAKYATYAGIVSVLAAIVGILAAG